MLILIDGYNLLFQSNLVGKGRGPRWLEQARNRLIRLLISRLSTELVGKTTIVFDASQPVDPQSDYVTQEGMRIVFAVEHPEADDLLEELIRMHPTPKRLQVVSSDLRVQRCGRSRRAQVIDAETFLQRCESGCYRRQATGQPESQEQNSMEGPELSQDEIQFWMREFLRHKESE